ncbi:MAG: DNA/RNA non-specific endonuclease [Ferruginibacter sp.]
MNLFPISRSMRVITLFLVSLKGLSLFAQTVRDPGLPKCSQSGQIVHHPGFSLCYHESHEQASWVAYELTAAETIGTYKRTDRFFEDPFVKTGSASDIDYKGSGFDRGHLAPAADMGWSAESMIASFYYSNMSPQLPGFNRGIWKSLEELIRTWARQYTAIQVVTGPVLEKDLPTIGIHQVRVPRYYYKVILWNDPLKPKAIGFLMANQSSKELLSRLAVSVDQVEKWTGIDFFSGLPDDIENTVEKSFSTSDWVWQSVRPAISIGTKPGTRGSTQTSTGHTCAGITQKGAPCKNRVKAPGGYCYHHKP